MKKETRRILIISRDGFYSNEFIITEEQITLFRHNIILFNIQEDDEYFKIHNELFEKICLKCKWWKGN